MTPNGVIRQLELNINTPSATRFIEESLVICSTTESENRENEKKSSNNELYFAFVLSTLSADGWVPLGDRTSAVTAMIKVVTSQVIIESSY